MALEKRLWASAAALPKGFPFGTNAQDCSSSLRIYSFDFAVFSAFLVLRNEAHRFFAASDIRRRASGDKRLRTRRPLLAEFVSVRPL